jgi:hypothetical protein
MRRQPLVFAILASLTLLVPLAFAPGGNRWAPSWTTQLDVELNHAPGPDEEWTELAGTVKDASKLKLLGFASAAQGMKITIRAGERLGWKAEIDGKQVELCELKVTAGDVERTLVPERGSLKLKPK